MRSVRLDRRGMTLLAVAHVIDDVNQSALPALLPFLIVDRHLSYTAAAGLMFFGSVSSSVVQPLIGWFSDRRSMPWLIALGVFLAGAGYAIAGIMPTYATIALGVALSGFGVAVFHPEAARFANYVAGERKASGMRWFALGGNVGFALGPLALTPALLAFGPPGTLVMLVPAGVIAAVVLRELPRLRGFAPARGAARRTMGRDRWSAFGRLTAYVVLRSMAYVGLVTFIPLLFIGELHAGAAAANTALALFLACGAAGTIVGGRLTDRVGRRTIMLASTLVSAPLLLGAAALASAFANAWLVLPAIALLGFTLVASQTAFVVLGQEYLPNRVGTASGVTLGLAISLGGACSPLLGSIADHHGLVAVMESIAGLLALATVAGATLPRDAPVAGRPNDAPARAAVTADSESRVATAQRT